MSKQSACVAIFNFFAGAAPVYVSEIFLPHNSHITHRSQNKLWIPNQKTNRGLGNISMLDQDCGIACQILWNLRRVSISLNTNPKSCFLITYETRKKSLSLLLIFGRPIENRRPMFLSSLVSWLVVGCWLLVGHTKLKKCPTSFFYKNLFRYSESLP